jgi:hypothetical protein
VSCLGSIYPQHGEATAVQRFRGLSLSTIPPNSNLLSSSPITTRQCIRIQTKIYQSPNKPPPPRTKRVQSPQCFIASCHCTVKAIPSSSSAGTTFLVLVIPESHVSPCHRRCGLARLLDPRSWVCTRLLFQPIIAGPVFSGSPAVVHVSMFKPC